MTERLLHSRSPLRQFDASHVCCGHRTPLVLRPYQQRQQVAIASRQSSRHNSVSMAAIPSDIFVMDFDGVICNTQPEVSWANACTPCLSLGTSRVPGKAGQHSSTYQSLSSVDSIVKWVLRAFLHSAVVDLRLQGCTSILARRVCKCRLCQEATGS